MPFTKPFKDPAKGDLVYGVDADFGRRKYLKDDRFKAAGVFTVDELQVLPTETSKTKNADFLEAVAQHQKYKSALAEHQNENESVRRKCKAGLEWGVSNKKQIHFCLDGLDLAAVVEKNNKQGNSDTPADIRTPKNRSITGSELRWIYRNRSKSEVQEHIQFWYNSKQCAPPWEEDVTVVMSPTKSIVYPATLWMNYTPRSENWVVEVCDSSNMGASAVHDGVTSSITAAIATTPTASTDSTVISNNN